MDERTGGLTHIVTIVQTQGSCKIIVQTQGSCKTYLYDSFNSTNADKLQLIPYYEQVDQGISTDCFMIK